MSMAIDKAPALNIERVGNGVIVKFMNNALEREIPGRGYHAVPASDHKEFTIVFSDRMEFVNWLNNIWWPSTQLGNTNDAG